ncbi:MAG: outer membrane beta-barrel protein [Gemmatimonadaceae bacterium]
MKYSSRASIITLVLLLPFATALAQTAPKEQPSKWSLSVGIDPTHLNLNTNDPGVAARFVANLTRSWQSPGSRFSRQISLMLGADAPRQQIAFTEPCDQCWNKIGYTYAGLTGGGSLDLFHVSRFTPYVQGGLGFYWTRATSQPVNGFVLTSNLNTIYDRSQVSLGINGGLGIKARFASHEFFVEQALHAFDVYQMGRGVYPLNFGIRF